jgi:hypothetical protein
MSADRILQCPRAYLDQWKRGGEQFLRHGIKMISVHRRPMCVCPRNSKNFGRDTRRRSRRPKKPNRTMTTNLREFRLFVTRLSVSLGGSELHPPERYNSRMIRLARLCLLLAGVIDVSAQTFFSSGTADEEIKGQPKSVRVERQLGDKRSLLEETQYREDGKMLEHRSYREEATLSYREVHEYDGGQRTRTTTFDGQGKVLRVQTYRHIEDQVEEEVALDGGGKQMERTICKFDEAGRVVSQTLTDTDKTEMRMGIEYDDHGRPIDARITMKSAESSLGTGLHIAIGYQADKHALMTAYGPDGSIVSQVQTSENEAGRELAQVLFDRDNSNSKTTIEQVDSSDSHGNWTQKTSLERNPRTQVDEPVVTLHRTITYF